MSYVNISILIGTAVTLKLFVQFLICSNASLHMCMIFIVLGLFQVCDETVELIRSTGREKREMREIMEQNENLKSEKYGEKIAKLKSDLAQLKAEIKSKK